MDEAKAAAAREIRRKMWPPEQGGQAPLPVPDEIRQDWAASGLETVLGSTWARTEQLPLRDRSLITVAALTVLHRPEELKIHIRGALNNGVTRAEVAEIMWHMSIYGGFPVAIEGMRAARAVFDELDGANTSEGKR
jgi:4-carboxymuconolactone decarboxylase